MSMRVWLQEMTGNEVGWVAWCLDVQGFATWAETEGEVLARVPGKLEAHKAWLARHGLVGVAASSEASNGAASGVEVVDTARGNEVLFLPDCEPCEVSEIELTLRLLSASRADLVQTVEGLPEQALDWDPPYRAFLDWATWRSVRQILAHVANCETHYYLPAIGGKSQLPAASPEGDWHQFLAAHRAQTVSFLEQLKESRDRARVIVGGEAWSVRKVLRRLVWHELLHWKSIRRIGREFEQQA